MSYPRPTKLCSACGGVLNFEMPKEDPRYPTNLGLVFFEMCECEEPQIYDGNAASNELVWRNLIIRAALGDWSEERQLAELAELLEAGALTEQEFQTLKTRLIDGGKS